MSRPKTRAPRQAAAVSPGGLHLLLGWKSDESKDPIGFGAPRQAVAPIEGEQPILYGEDRHLVTIAPTGAGKGRGVIIPNLLRFEGSVIVIDPKGETWHVTHRRRREMGQEVRLLDPFGAVSRRTDALNPFDLFDRPGALLDADSEMLASLLAGDAGFHKEPFWTIGAGR
jgi:type IV secretion system protein VirD4